MIILEKAFMSNGDSYMDDKKFRFRHQGRCTPNPLNEHITDLKSLKE